MGCGLSLLSLQALSLGLALLGLVLLPAGLVAQTIDLPLGDLPDNSTVEVTFEVTLAACIPAGLEVLPNTATVDGENLAMPSSGMVGVPVTALPDLALTGKSDGGASAGFGAPVVYTIGYANNGNQAASGVTITETVPAGTQFAAGSSTAGWVCAPDGSAGSTCTFEVGALTCGGSGSVDFAVSLVPPVGSLAQITNTASIDDGDGGEDADSGNDTAMDTTPVLRPDLTVTKADDGTPQPGGTLTYTIDYDNPSSQAASGVTLTETVPANTTFDAGSSTPGWMCAPDASAGSTCTFVLETLNGGDSGQVTFAVTLDDPLAMGVTELSNTVTIEDDGNAGDDTNPADNSFTLVTPLDSEAPEVTGVDAVPSAGGLDDCQTLNDREVTGLTVTFDEVLRDSTPIISPPPAPNPGDADDPDAYLLVSPGAPGSGFDTAGCTGGTGGDTVIPVASAAWDEMTMTTTLDLGGELPDGLYRLYVCGTGPSALTDEAGNPLDGDGDGTGGEDFRIDFRVDSENLFANGHFDCTLDGWSVAETLAVTTAWSPEDVDGSPLSGSAEGDNPAAAGSAQGFDLSQCVAVSGGNGYELGLSFAYTAPSPANLVVMGECELFAAAGCGGGSLGVAAQVSQFLPLPAASLSWQELTKSFTAGAGAASARCTFSGDTLGGQAFQVFFDDLSLSEELGDEIFSDGFESGDTSAWSATVDP